MELHLLILCINYNVCFSYLNLLNKLELYSYRPPKANREELKKAVVDFIEHQDYEKAYKQLTSSDYVWSFLSNKSKHQQVTVKEHVKTTKIKKKIYFQCYESLELYFLLLYRYSGTWECFISQLGLLCSHVIVTVWKGRKAPSFVLLKNGINIIFCRYIFLHNNLRH